MTTESITTNTTITTCADCGAELDRAEVQVNLDLAPICDACAEDYDTCADCGDSIRAGVYHNADGDSICESCADDYVTCADCDAIVKTDSPYQDDHGDPICESCAENYYICEHCGAIIADGDGTWIKGMDGIVCDECLARRYVKCEDCGEYFPHDDVFLVSGGAYHICHDCYCNGDYFTCDGCGEIFSQDNYGGYDASNGENFCDSCWEDRGGSGPIHEYGYKPDWIRHQTAQDRAAYPCIPDRFYLGIELEVENKARDYDNDEIAQEVIDNVPAVCKHDSSIHYGFEIVFHPQTFSYATTDGRKLIEDMLANLRQSGFAGHDFGGIHVHISRSAFTRLHLYKHHLLYLNCRSLFTRISQRKVGDLDHWASFGNLTERPLVQTACRYSALNYGRDTVEVRIFNSTIRTDRFFKNLEAVKAALDFSKQYGIRDMTPDAFLRFIMYNRPLYKNLAAFLVERSADTLTAAHVDAKAIKQVHKSLERRRA